jgi:hypothetical protein
MTPPSTIETLRAAPSSRSIRSKKLRLLNRLDEVIKLEFFWPTCARQRHGAGAGQQVFDRIRRSALARVSHWPDHAFGVCDIFALVKNPFGPVPPKDEADGLPLALEGTATEGADEGFQTRFQMQEIPSHINQIMAPKKARISNRGRTQPWSGEAAGAFPGAVRPSLVPPGAKRAYGLL